MLLLAGRLGASTSRAKGATDGSGCDQDFNKILRPCQPHVKSLSHTRSAYGVVEGAAGQSVVCVRVCVWGGVLHVCRAGAIWHVCSQCSQCGLMDCRDGDVRGMAALEYMLVLMDGPAMENGVATLAWADI